MHRYTDALEALDLKGFAAQADMTELIANTLHNAEDQENLNQELVHLYKDVLEGRLPWDGNFDMHMSDPEKSLHFES